MKKNMKSYEVFLAIGFILCITGLACIFVAAYVIRQPKETNYIILGDSVPVTETK